MVGRGQRGKRDLVVARARKPAHDGGDDLVGGPLAHRTVRHACLAEAAAARASPQHLDGKPVLHDLGIGHERRVDRIERLEVGDDTLHDLLGRTGPLDGNDMRAPKGILLGAVEKGHVDAGYLRERRKDVGAGRIGCAHVADAASDLDDDLLAIAHHDAVVQLAHGLGVVDRRSPAADDGVVLRTVARHERDTRQVERLDDVAGSKLMGKLDAHHVERRHGEARLHGEERQVAAAHEVGHVDPGRVGALAGNAGLVVQNLVQDGQALVGKADLVRIRVDEHAAEGRLRVAPCAEFVVDVARRLLNQVKERLDAPPKVNSFMHRDHRSAPAP